MERKEGGFSHQPLEEIQQPTKEELEEAMRNIEEDLRFGSTRREKAGRERMEVERKKQLVEKYGVLGMALFDYVDNRNRPGITWEEVTKDRQLFAECLNDCLSNPDRETRVTALTALLEAIEGKIEPVAKKAEDAYFRTAPIIG